MVNNRSERAWVYRERKEEGTAINCPSVGLKNVVTLKSEERPYPAMMSA